MAKPKLSVVMPVHNAMPYLVTAIESVIGQTFADFDLFIGDDCSSDGALDCIRDFARRDSRIRFGRSDVHLGPVGSSNWVASQAVAPIVARMDADDVCNPRRFELQMKVLAKHPDAVMVGAFCDYIAKSGCHLLDCDRSFLLHGRLGAFAHPTIMYRNQVFKELGQYRQGTDYFEDVDLFLRFSKAGNILVIADDLVSVRMTDTNARLTSDEAVVGNALIATSNLSMNSEHPVLQVPTLTPGVFRGILIRALWSGVAHVRILRLLKRMRMSPLPESLVTVAWAVTCALAPSLARRIERARIGWKNWRSGAALNAGHVYRWAPGKLAADLGAIE
jgi:hypothetical protein